MDAGALAGRWFAPIFELVSRGTPGRCAAHFGCEVGILNGGCDLSSEYILLLFLRVSIGAAANSARADAPKKRRGCRRRPRSRCEVGLRVTIACGLVECSLIVDLKTVNDSGRGPFLAFLHLSEFLLPTLRAPRSRRATPRHPQKRA